MADRDPGPAFRIETIELIALRKLLIVSKALATKLGGRAAIEQRALADTLGRVLDRYEEAEAVHAARITLPSDAGKIEEPAP